MTYTQTRRDLFASSLALGAGLLCPEVLLAAATAPWTLGFADVDADIAPRALKRLNGRAPVGLAGSLFRNGPAKWRRGDTSVGHWFDGDGLIRAFRLDGEGGARLDARFASTPKRRLEEELGEIVQPGFGTIGRPGSVVTSSDSTNGANTNVIFHNGELLALWEAGSPTAMDPVTLETHGLKSFRPDLAHMPFLAHPRTEPDGTIWNIGLAGRRAIIWCLAPDGTLKTAETIALPRASYMHDFTATARHLILVFQPWIQGRTVFPFVNSLSWKPEEGTRVLVIDKADLSRQRVYELPTFAFFHLGDAWEESDGTIRFDGCISDNPTIAADEGRALLEGRVLPIPAPELAMIALHPDGRGNLSRSGIQAEFPQTDGRRAGSRRRLTAHVTGFSEGRPLPQAIGVWDWQTGRDDVWSFGPDHLVEEFILVPKPGRAAEQDAWLMGLTLNLKARATELHILDAARVASGPIASWRADVALPIGLHGCFVRA